MGPLHPGATGAAVQDVQQRLRLLGHAVGDEDGEFGPDTERAVRAFQQTRRLLADGVVGDDTWTALVDAGQALGDRLLYLTRPWLRGDDVRALQRSLGRLGFDSGSVDGIHGPDTDAALRDFQHNVGIVVDGIAGPSTLGLLRALWRRHQAATSFEVIERHTVVRFPAGLTGLRILLDPARGPSSPGHVRDGWSEADIAMDIAARLRGQLTARGATTVLTRAGDRTPTPRQRASLANELEVDLVLTVACAAVVQPGPRGVSALYFGDGEVGSDRGRRLADVCVDAVATATGSPNCHSHASTSSLLRECRAPAAIVEVGFLSHEEEGRRLVTPDGRHTIASALADAVHAWASPVPRPHVVEGASTAA